MIPKFRFFDKGYKIWLHPDQVWLDETGAFRGVDGVSRFETVGDDLVVMQSTGQKDCNNSGIFDADILLEPWTGRIVGRVFYSLGDSAWKVLLVGGGEEYLSDCLDLQVCGNIYENPDLVEG